MSRLNILARRPKRTLGVLATALAATGVAIGSGAAFTAQTANPSNTFTAGTLTMSNSLDNAAILTASNMKPGDVTTGTVDIANTGSVAGTFTLSRTNLTDSDGVTPMSAKLNVLVEDCGDFAAGAPACDAADPDIYNSTLDTMNGSYALGSYPGGASGTTGKHRYKFTVTFDSTAGNPYQGDNSSARFQWDATS